MSEKPKPAHTPGPWEVVGLAAHDVIATTDSTVICRVPGNGPSHFADAKLIARAPTMLAALNRAIRYHREWVGSFNDVLCQMEAAVALSDEPEGGQ